MLIIWRIEIWFIIVVAQTDWRVGRGVQQITYIGIERASFKHKLQARLSLYQIRMLRLNTLLSMNVAQLFFSSQKNLFENSRINSLEMSWWRNLYPDQNCLWLSLNLRGRGAKAIYWSKHWIWNFKRVRGNTLRGEDDIGFKIERPNHHSVILLRFEMEMKWNVIDNAMKEEVNIGFKINNGPRMNSLFQIPSLV